MNIFMYANQLLQEVTTGAYFCDISNSTNTYGSQYTGQKTGFQYTGQ